MLESNNESTFQLFLALIKDNQTPVAVYLISGIKLLGTITGYDKEGVFLKNGITQFVYFHHISTIIPDVRQAIVSNRSAHQKEAKKMLV